jgi:lantibiotic biosynthesis protein
MTSVRQAEGRVDPDARERAKRPLLAAPHAERALAIAERIVARAAAAAFERASEHPETLGGFAGCLLVAEALARAGGSPPRPLRELAREALVVSPHRRGLYDGSAGLLAVLDALDRDGTAFARPRAALRAGLAEDLLATGALDPADRPGFDLIRGAAGKLIALREVPEDVAAHVRARFEELAPRAAERIADPDPERAAIDLGVAHGIPGVLAALNLALPRERALARRYADLIAGVSHVVGGARRWDGAWFRERTPPPRRAWCYQTAGVAAVLYDRAVLDGDEALRELALDALRATLAEPEQRDWDDALCHGRSGVALIYAHVAHEDERFARAAERLALEVLHRHREDAELEEDRLQFLDGALGVALFLIEAAAPSERRWLPLLGLRPETRA